MGDLIHDDVERALAAYGGADLPYRTFGTFSIHPRVPVVTDSAPVEADIDLSIRDPADVPTFYADEAPTAPSAPPVRMEPAFAPQPVVAAAVTIARDEPEPRDAAPYRPAPPEPAEPPPVAYVPPPPPGYTPAYDPYHGRLPASAVPAALRGAAPMPFVPSYPPPPALYDARPAQPAPEPVRRGSEMNIFQLAWNSAAAATPSDGGESAGPRAAAQDGPLPGAEDLFRRI